MFQLSKNGMNMPVLVDVSNERNNRLALPYLKEI